MGPGRRAAEASRRSGWRELAGRVDALHRARRRRRSGAPRPRSSRCSASACDVGLARTSRQRRGFCFLDANGERTITVLSEKLRPRRDEPLPWDALAEFDGGLLHRRRRGRAARGAGRRACSWRPPGSCRRCARPAVELDALVASASDPAERVRGRRPRPGAAASSSSLSAGTRAAGSSPGGALGGRAAVPARSRTPTARGTRSRPGSRSGSPRGGRPRRRPRSPPAAPPSSSRAAARTACTSRSSASRPRVAAWSAGVALWPIVG